MGTYPPKRPDPLLERIENLEILVRQIETNLKSISLKKLSEIFETSSEGYNIRKLEITKDKKLKVTFENGENSG